jgi:hypothetical protein
MKYNFNEEVSFYDNNYLLNVGIIKSWSSNNTYGIEVGKDFYLEIPEHCIWRNHEQIQCGFGGAKNAFYEDLLLKSLSERMKPNHNIWQNDTIMLPRNLWENLGDSYYNRSISGLRGEDKEMSKLPRKVFFNKKKKATTLIFGDKPTVVKCGKGDKYSKRVGFLEAYFQATCGLSKTQAKKYLDKIIEEDAK